MVTFNIDDKNIGEVAALSNLRHTKTEHDFFVFGHAQGGEAVPKVSLFAPIEFTPADAGSMVDFLMSKGIKLTVHRRDAVKTISLGLDHRIQDNLELCNRCLDTLVYWLEGRLTGLPVQPTNPESTNQSNV